MYVYRKYKEWNKRNKRKYRNSTEDMNRNQPLQSPSNGMKFGSLITTYIMLLA